MSKLSPQDVERLLPGAAAWVAEKERVAFESGWPLTADLLSFTKRIGLARPDLVRVVAVPCLPIPDDKDLLAAGLSVGLFTIHAEARAFRYGIFVREDCSNRNELLRHELVHTKQYEQCGSIEAFLRKYTGELLECGYQWSPMEAEARRLASIGIEPIETVPKSSGYFGIPWKSGGADRRGVSCSGLVWLWLNEQTDFRAPAPTLPPNVPMECSVMPEFKQSNFQRGDVVFFRHRVSGKITHCAVCIADGKYLHILRGCGSRTENGFVMFKRLKLDLVGALTPRQAQLFYQAVEREHLARASELQEVLKSPCSGVAE